MIVQCAACQARFKIADDKVTDRGVKVRCRKCSTIFVVRKDGSSEVPAAAPAASPAAGPAPAPAPAAGGAADPFRRFQTNEIPTAGAFAAPAAANDPFAGLGIISTPPATSAPARAAGKPGESLDPFAGLSLGGPPAGPLAPSAPAPAPAAQDRAADPFANIDINAAAPPKPASPRPADPFADLGIGAPAAAPAPSAGAPLDPFAGFSLSGPSTPAAAGAPAPRPATEPLVPAVPGALDLGSIEVGPKDPALDGDEPMGANLEAPAPPLSSTQPAEPSTVVRSIKWAGGDQDKVTVQSPASAYAGQLLAAQKARARPRRNLAVSLLAALVFLGLGGVVLERTARAIHAATVTPSPTAPLRCRDLRSAFYPTREGRAVFVVHGKVDNHTGNALQPAVKVTVELRRRSHVERTADAYVGTAPTAEALWKATGPLEISELVQKVGSRAAPLPAGATGDFLAVFSEYPDNVSDLVIHAAAAAAPLPPPPAPKAVEVPQAGPPAAAKASTGGGASGKPPKLPDFPMDDPRPFKLNSGQPGSAAGEPSRKKAPVELSTDDSKPVKVNGGPAGGAEKDKERPPREKKKLEFPMDDPKPPPKARSPAAGSGTPAPAAQP